MLIFDWTKFAAPAGLIAVPLAVSIIYFVYRPDPKFKFPRFEDKMGPWTALEKKTTVILLCALGFWLTKGIHGLDYSITGILAIAVLILTGVLEWEDIHKHLQWGTVFFIFGGGISLGLGMDNSGAARYFANLFFPLFKGSGWLIMFIGVAVFGALVTNAIAYSYRQFKSWDLTKAGLVATPVLLTALILVCAHWWKLLGLV